MEGGETWDVAVFLNMPAGGGWVGREAGLVRGGGRGIVGAP